MAKITALEKFFKTHKRNCSVHVYSGDRHCSCGRDEAWQEVLRLQSLSQPTKDAADMANVSEKPKGVVQIAMPLI